MRHEQLVAHLLGQPRRFFLRGSDRISRHVERCALYNGVAGRMR